MEVRSLHSPALTTIPPSRFTEKSPFFPIKLPGKRVDCAVSPRLRFLDFNAQRLGPAKIKSSATQDATVGSKDRNLVFVAGATGRVGSRTVRELLKLGFRVRAGVRSTKRAESLAQSVREMKLDGTQPTDMLELVECDLEKPDSIQPALDNSSVVICAIGASEKEVSDVTGPYRIDYLATKNLVDAATSAKVDHFILVTSLGTGKFGLPAALLNLFWGVLCWKRRAEEALLASGLPYTIVRPGGMERPTDSFKETHNLTLSEEDSLFGGLVSNLQVAELLAFMAKNQNLSYCKIVEAIAETTAPLTPFDELLKRVPSKREIPPSKVVLESTKKPDQDKAPAPTPQSPYTAYEDLKPPTSPTPSVPIMSGGNDKPGSSIDAKPTVVSHHKESETKTRPLSPYPMYEDLKPPSSPSPSMPKY